MDDPFDLLLHDHHPIHWLDEQLTDELILLLPHLHTGHFDEQHSVVQKTGHFDGRVHLLPLLPLILTHALQIDEVRLLRNDDLNDRLVMNRSQLLLNNHQRMLWLLHGNDGLLLLGDDLEDHRLVKCAFVCAFHYLRTVMGRS